MKILVVAGHPADMFDHCGGTLYHHIQQGDSVTCVTLTQGLRVHDEVIFDMYRNKTSPISDEEMERVCQERQEVKYKEVLDACKLFGIEDIRFLSYDDEILLPSNAEMVSKLAAVIREVHPDILITHWPFQGGGISNHHAVTGQLTEYAITAASTINFKDDNPSARIMRVFYMLCPADVTAVGAYDEGKMARITHFVDVSDVVDLKVKAIAMMKSQKYDIPGYAKKVTEYWNGNFGFRVRLPYAEGFASGPEVSKLLPIPDDNIYRALASEEELLRRQSDLSGIDVEVNERD